MPDVAEKFQRLTELDPEFAQIVEGLLDIALAKAQQKPPKPLPRSDSWSI
jgi:hypothetical protein